VAAQWINWRRQLRNGQGGSDKDNSDANNDNDAETKTTTTTTTALGSVGINAGTDAAAAIRQGSTTRGKRSRR
jgi:hypothetical protein